MTVTTSGARADFQQLLSQSQSVRIRYFNVSGADANYDDDVVLTQSGTDFWASGLVQPLDLQRGSYDAVLVEQGKLLQNDLKCYVPHTVETSGTWRIGIGSSNPPKREYAITDGGIISWTPFGEIVYQKLYLRYLTTGSLSQES